MTGGAGFIGSHLVDALIARGDEVAVADDLSTGSASNLNPAAAFSEIDVLDDAFPAWLEALRPDAVVHLAAQVSVSESLRDPERDRLVNEGGTRVVARAAAVSGARRVLSASSAAVYGEPAVIPVPEHAPKDPQNPYGFSKLAAESALAEELTGTGADFATLRFSNVYGPRQDWRGEGGVVAIFSARMTAGEPVTVNGDGSQTRDFIFVGDVVAAAVAALDAPGGLAAAGADGPALNVSTGAETTVESLASVLGHSIGYRGEVHHGPLPAGDIPRSALDPGKVARVLGWSAATPLQRGLAETASWFVSVGSAR